MILRPANLPELPGLLARARECGERISSFDLSAFNRVMEHKAEDMTATAEAGVSLADLQERLAERGQWLPVDPPRPERLSLGALLGGNESGPHRFGCGTVRDYLLGIKVVLADGRIVSFGGKVVKNVAGYDLGKLFIGSRGSLGVIVEAVFKLCPRPEAEMFVEARFAALDEAGTAIEAVLNSGLAPAVLDLHKALPAAAQFTVVLGFAGPREDVQWQLGCAADLGFRQASSLQYEEEFWDGRSGSGEGEVVRKVAVLPSKLIGTVQSLGVPFVARAGNGIMYYRGPAAGQKSERPLKLAQRLKQTFDPLNVLPDAPV
ncbi:Glycolate oxidase subunit GlcE [Verrucomicrobia bacterium]|nr:Glycolate oxidase subunit GlcE [Verrucomicrobiota bacterium]